MRIIKIKPEKPIKESIRSGNNFKITLYADMPNTMTGVGRKFAIKKLKYLKTTEEK